MGEDRFRQRSVGRQAGGAHRRLAGRARAASFGAWAMGDACRAVGHLFARSAGPVLLGVCVAGLGLGLAWAGTEAADRCVSCHSERTQGFSEGHRFGEADCTACHGGDGEAGDERAAHQGLLAFPGNLSNAARACGGCHGERVASVSGGFMATGRGMVEITRHVLGEHPATRGGGDLSALSHRPADALLRKLCASCHLGQEKRRHAHDVTRDRGGGCLACHLNHHPQDGHPPLSARVQDGRCFGCHSRSSRISLSYAGLAEVDGLALDRMAPERLARLDDGRLVEHRPPDVHHRAGMACIDCHTATGLMGSAEGLTYQREAVDIACEDCHRNRGPRLRVSDRTQVWSGLRRGLPFVQSPEGELLRTARFGSPLWHIEVRPAGLFLHRKLAGGAIRIPQMTPESHPAEGHEHLTCTACHSQWAPQCFGCHLGYDPAGQQWDHVERRATPGRWVETRWGVRNGPPPLGVTAEGRVAPFVPGMILTVEHPNWEQPMFARLFVAIAPHTTGASRACPSCHTSSEALGLGRGALTKGESGWSFEPVHAALGDGLPADAWTGLNSRGAGEAARRGERPLNRREMLRILEAGARVR